MNLIKMMENLFEEKERKDLTQPTHKETEMEFFERFGSNEAELRRQILNAWYQNYPEVGRKELKSRLKHSFSTALYELFIHELFLKQGFTLSLHPAVSGTTKRPDFLACKNDVEFYIEATEASELTQQEKGIDKKTKAVWDAVDKVNSPNFFFCIIGHIFKSNNQPSGKKIIKFFEEELNKYTIEQITENLNADYEDRIRIKYDDEDFILVVSLIPKPKDIIGKKGFRSIGMYASEPYFGTKETIKYSIERKSRRYGELDKPLVVCVNTGFSLSLTEHTVFDILFGHLAVTWSTNPNNRDERYERLWTGVLGNPKVPRVKKATGILITGVNSGTLVDPKHWLFKHPFPKNPLDFDLFELSFHHVEANKILPVQKKSIKEILFK